VKNQEYWKKNRGGEQTLLDPPAIVSPVPVFPAASLVLRFSFFVRRYDSTSTIAGVLPKKRPVFRPAVKVLGEDA
jgi:hypothetical protein